MDATSVIFEYLDPVLDQKQVFSYLVSEKTLFISSCFEYFYRVLDQTTSYVVSYYSSINPYSK